jgi:hypothetical protein
MVNGFLTAGLPSMDISFGYIRVDMSGGYIARAGGKDACGARAIAPYAPMFRAASGRTGADVAQLVEQRIRND